MTVAQVAPLDVLASPVRRSMLDVLATLPHSTGDDAPHRSQGLTAAELATRLELHVTTVRFHLDRLQHAGLVSSHNERKGVGRPRRRYTATPGELTSVASPDSYQLLAEVLASALASGTIMDAAQAGRQWALDHAVGLVGAESMPASSRPARTAGEWLAKVGAVVDVLDSWGYRPSVTTTEGGRTAQVCLHHCPVRQPAVDNPTVACGVHRGVIQGTLAALGEDSSTVSLAPFVEPDLCVAHVRTTTPFTSRPVSDRSTERPAR